LKLSNLNCIIADPCGCLLFTLDAVDFWLSMVVCCLLEIRGKNTLFYGGTKRKTVGVNNAIDTRNSFMYFNLSIFLLIF